MTPLNQEPLYTPDQVATRLQINKDTVYRLIRAGDLPAIQIGRRYRVTPLDLRLFLAARSTSTQAREARFQRVMTIGERNADRSPDEAMETLEQLDASRPSSIA